MKKSTLLLAVITILLTLLFTSCSISNDNAQIKTEDVQKNIEKGEDKMEKQLLTKDEFIKYIEENQDSDTVDITIADLESIDINDFISHYQYTKDNIDLFFLKYALERYMKHVSIRKLEPYMAKEIISVDSSVEEYTAFKEAYLKKIDLLYEFLFIDDYDIDNYDMVIEGRSRRIQIGQTKNLEKCLLIKNNNDVYCVTYKVDASGLQRFTPIIYSSDFKYFILANMHDENEYEIIKTFCGIDD